MAKTPKEKRLKRFRSSSTSEFFISVCVYCVSWVIFDDVINVIYDYDVM